MNATPGPSPDHPTGAARPVRVPASLIPFCLLFLFLFAAVPAVHAADSQPGVCLECHGEHDADTPFLDAKVFRASVHRDVECTDCHSDVDPDDLPHAEKLAPVYCGTCHDDAQLDYDASIHGQAFNRHAPYAPSCKECHGIHDIFSPQDPRSRAYKMNVPYLCGKCHREGAPVANTYEIGEHKILENYTESIHGEGLFKKGLMVTAACADCHNAHLILPHTEPRASISPRNITSTCMRCHAQIEQVHTKVIRGELWEKAPGAIPACTDCHVPHRVRKEVTELTISDRNCLKCHAQAGLYSYEHGDTTLVTVNAEQLATSIHRTIPCVKCHVDVDPRLKRPCEPSGPVDCSNCHAKISEEYTVSGHGQARGRGIAEAPYCTTCHGSHGTKSHLDESSPTHRALVPALCGDCHQEKGKASMAAADLSEKSALADYSHSVHGRALTEKGLLPSAVCIDCHSSHMVLKHSDERSTVSKDNLPATCAQCHRGIYKEYIKSVHYSASEKDRDKLPTCASCHSSHTIGDVTQDAFLTQVTGQCGSCHEELGKTYLDTMHGKAYRLGYLEAAKCSDCHGAHQILAVNDPNSAVGHRNIVGTCQKCHADANARFTGYLTHATHHDPKKYPVLFYSYWAMTLLLIGVFTFFGLHTIMWLPRSFRHMKEHRKHRKKEPVYYIRRFTPAQRVTHLFVVTSFLTLALTGMMLKFSHMTWAGHLANALGGVKVAGVIHRIAAVTTFGYFTFHLISLVRMKRAKRLAWTQMVLGPGSMMFNRKDLHDFIGTLKWFFGAGPRPQYGRWTYWEKFDYLAVFWGVAVIGFTGLMLWLPVLFTKVLPGWLINVATIIHSDEALLAVGFIFTIHFFNTHLRPEAFPMDTVVFTGLTPLEDYIKDRPAEYEEMKRTGEIRRRLVKTVLSRRYMLGVRIAGSVFLGVGLVLIGLIIYSMIFGYR
jgi:cytochrome b subunit of formate dehydrogenase